MAKLLHVKADPELYAEVFSHYFEERHASSVEAAWRLIMGAKDQADPGDGIGSPELFKIALTNKDTPYEPCLDPEEGDLMSWLDNIKGKDTAGMRVCDKGYKYPSMAENKCDSLGDRVSGKMSTLSGIILHELNVNHLLPLCGIVTDVSISGISTRSASIPLDFTSKTIKIERKGMAHWIPAKPFETPK